MNQDIQYLRGYLPRAVVFGPAPSGDDQRRAERAVESLSDKLEADTRELEALRAIVSQAVNPRTVRSVADSHGDNWSHGVLIAAADLRRKLEADAREMPNRGEFINPQNASEAHARAVEALERGDVSRAVAWLCDAVRLLQAAPKCPPGGLVEYCRRCGAHPPADHDSDCPVNPPQEPQGV